MSSFYVGQRVVVRATHVGDMNDDPIAGVVVEVCGRRKIKILWVDGCVKSHDPSGPYMSRFEIVADEF